MSEIYLWLKWAHVVSSTVLFGMGAGIAFFFVRAQRTGDVRVIAAVGREVVIADAIFTASAVVLQPVTGLAMVTTRRISAFPAVVAMVDRAVRIDWVLLAASGVATGPDAESSGARDAGRDGVAHLRTLRYYRWWFYLGWPAFTGVLVVFYLMVVKPAI
jgi:uncharacterized membrane protein